MEPTFLVQDTANRWLLGMNGASGEVSIGERDGIYSFDFIIGRFVCEIFFTSFNNDTANLEGRYTMTRVDQERSDGPKGMVEFKANPEKSEFTGGPTNFACMVQWTLTRVPKQAEGDDKPEAGNRKVGCIIS